VRSDPLKQGRDPQPSPASDELADLRRLGHRDFVGGLWDEIGKLQFDFLVAQGLEPHHVLLDIGCGSLRGGVHFIPYLDPGHYLGIDKHAELIEAGLAELGNIDRGQEFVVSDSFEFARFSKRPDYAIAQSLFTHLTKRDIARCLRRLRRFATDCRLYATFFEGRNENPGESHSRETFHYPRPVIERVAARAGWHTTFIGEWGHPRGQLMMALTALDHPGSRE
jgi:SAM-dependent methyltransferase